MENMTIWQALESTPKEAQKEISAGRLKGFTDINPMWRLKRLTEVFGPCGIGWKYVITNSYVLPGANDEIAAFVEILLYHKQNGEWSDGVPGLGGSMFVAKERSGLHTSDECFKMALSDAIGTACKALGMSADIYFSKDRSKYTVPKENAPVQVDYRRQLIARLDDLGIDINEYAQKHGLTNKTSQDTFKDLLADLR